MTTPLAIAGYTGTYAPTLPYLTALEYTNAPTAVDTSNLVQNGSQGQNTQELLALILRASSWANTLCHQVLAATQDTEVLRLRVNGWGIVRFPCRFKPVLEVDAVSVGFTPSQLVALDPGDGANILILRSGIVEIPVFRVSAPAIAGTYPLATGVGSRPIVQVTYVNGWPNTLLGAVVTAGATSLTVFSALGIYPGSTLTVYDDLNGNEQVVVASTYTQGSTTLPLVSPVVYAHAGGVSVTALPAGVKQAVIELTSALVKTRGNLSIVMPSTPEGQPKIQGEDPAVAGNIDLATTLLAEFRRMW